MKLAMIAAVKPFNFALWFLLILALAVAGPFGTYATVGFGGRLLYWAPVVLVACLLGYQASFIARYLTRRRPPIIADLVATAIMCGVFGPLNWVFTQATLSHTPTMVPNLGLMMVYIAALSLAILTGRRLIPGLEKLNYLPRTHDVNQPRLLRRLAEGDRSRVLYLSSQGHFVEVVTDQGVTRLRMRLADAIDDMDGVPGYATHRSHWVAESAIARMSKTQGKLHLHLSNGETVPVSRTYQARLEKAGFA